MHYESLHEDLPPPVEESSLLSDHSGNSENFISEDSIINQDILEEVESEVNVNYPNEVYEDFMTLVIKNKLNNKVGNEIIHFFNKHANLTKSPLPKSTEQGRQYMDNMNQPNLVYQKTCVITYNNIEYYLHHCNLINCIKNILTISNIMENFALNFENLEVII